MEDVDGEVPDDAIYVDLTEEDGDWMRETEDRTSFSELSDEEAALKAREYGLKLFDLYLRRVHEADYEPEEADAFDDSINVVEDTLERGAKDAEALTRALQ